MSTTKAPWINTADNKTYDWNESTSKWEPRPKLVFADWNDPAFDGPSHCAMKKLPPLKNLNTENSGE